MALKGKHKKIAIGCGVAGCLGLVTLVVVLVLAGRAGSAFLEFGIGTDLSDYEDTIRDMDLDAARKERLVDAIAAVRLSVDRENNFSFFQWLRIDEEIQGMLRDGEIDDGEYTALLAEIRRMKEIQEIAAD